MKIIQWIQLGEVKFVVMHSIAFDSPGKKEGAYGFCLSFRGESQAANPQNWLEILL